MWSVACRQRILPRRLWRGGLDAGGMGSIAASGRVRYPRVIPMDAQQTGRCDHPSTLGFRARTTHHPHDWGSRMVGLVRRHSWQASHSERGPVDRGRNVAWLDQRQGSSLPRIGGTFVCHPNNLRSDSGWRSRSLTARIGGSDAGRLRLRERPLPLDDSSRFNRLGRLGGDSGVHSSCERL